VCGNGRLVLNRAWIVVEGGAHRWAIIHEDDVVCTPTKCFAGESCLAANLFAGWEAGFAACKHGG